MTPPPSVSFPALGSTAFVAVAEPDRLGAARGAVERVVAAFDDACSRFRPDSELSRVNAEAGADVAASALLLEAVGAAVRAAELTDGDVDPTIGKALVALGYDRDFDELGDPPVARRSMSIAAVPGWRTIRIDRERATLRIPRGVALDLGATAKALAADRAAADASAAADCGVLVGLGGDFATAGEAPEGGWPVRVTDDHRADVEAPGQWIWLRTGGPRHLEHDRPPLAGGAQRAAPPRRSRHRHPRRHRVADSERHRGLVPGREHRQHRRHHPGRAGRRVAVRPRAAEPARAGGRNGRARGRLAGGRRRPRHVPDGAGGGVRMTLPLASVGPSAYWYLARGTGVVSLLLLTASVVLGVMGSVRFAAAPRWPRFAVDTVHRDISLLVLAVLLVHIVTSVLDSFAPIKLTDAIIPLASSYRPLWMGLGALAFDLLIALALTSMLRRRIGYRTWRWVHWLAYVSWPVAVLHGLGTGSDVKSLWLLALTVACVVAVLAAVLARVAKTENESDGRRGVAIGLAIAVPVGLAVFTLAGPLQSGWARRAGTPASVFAKLAPSAATVAARGSAPQSSAATSTPAPKGTLKLPFEAHITGTVTQRQAPGGALVDLALRFSGGARGRLRVRLAGTPAGGGGLSMTGSQVDLLADGLPDVLQGRIVELQGQQFEARVSGGGSDLDLRADLSIDQGSGSVTGSLLARRVGTG